MVQYYSAEFAELIMAQDYGYIGFADEDIPRIGRCVSAFEHQVIGPATQPRREPQNVSVWYRAKLASSMAAGSLEDPQEFTFNIWIPDTGSAPVPFIVSPNSEDLGLSGVNRKNVTGNTGDSIEVEFNNGEWTLRDIDCPES